MGPVGMRTTFKSWFEGKETTSFMLLNGMLPSTQQFLVTVGYVTGGINAFLLCGAATYLICVASGMLVPTMTSDEREKEFWATVKQFAPIVLCLGLLTMFTSSKILYLLSSNSQFAGAIGLLALAKLLLIGF